MLISKQRKQILKRLVNYDKNKRKDICEDCVESEHPIQITKSVNWKDVVWEMHDKAEYMEKFTGFVENEE